MGLLRVLEAGLEPARLIQPTDIKTVRSTSGFFIALTSGIRHIINSASRFYLILNLVGIPFPSIYIPILHLLETIWNCLALSAIILIT